MKSEAPQMPGTLELPPATADPPRRYLVAKPPRAELAPPSLLSVRPPILDLHVAAARAAAAVSDRPRWIDLPKLPPSLLDSWDSWEPTWIVVPVSFSPVGWGFKLKVRF